MSRRLRRQAIEFAAAVLRGDPPAEVDWTPQQTEEARHSFRVHGVAPLLTGAPLPDELSRYSVRQLAANRERVALLLDEWDRLQSTGLPILPLKGAVLARHYYADSGQRVMADLDVLIRPGDARRVSEALADLGYERIESTSRHVVFRHRDSPQRPVSLEGEHPDNPRKLDVHQTTGCREIDELLWCEPGPLSLLAHLLLHVDHHITERSLRLIWLNDLRLVTARLSSAHWRRLSHLPIRSAVPLWLADRYLGPFAPQPLPDPWGASRPAARRWLPCLDLYRLSRSNPQPPSRLETALWPQRRWLGASPVQAGSGWHPVEECDAQTFQWMGRHATVTLPPGMWRVRLEAERTGEPVVVDILDHRYEVVTSLPWQGHQSVSICHRSPRRGSLHFCVRGAPATAKDGDERELCLRVMRLEAEPADAPPGDIFRPGQVWNAGRGWFAVEHHGEAHFRWAQSHAVLYAGDEPEGRSLWLDAAPCSGPLQMRIHDGSGRLLAEFALEQRAVHRIAAPAGVIQLTASHSCRAPGDPRELSFRVFQAGWD